MYLRVKLTTLFSGLSLVNMCVTFKNLVSLGILSDTATGSSKLSQAMLHFSGDFCCICSFWLTVSRLTIDIKKKKFFIVQLLFFFVQHVASRNDLDWTA